MPMGIILRRCTSLDERGINFEAKNSTGATRMHSGRAPVNLRFAIFPIPLNGCWISQGIILYQTYYQSSTENQQMQRVFLLFQLIFVIYQIRFEIWRIQVFEISLILTA